MRETDTRPHTNFTFNEMLNLSLEELKKEWYDRGPTKNFLSDFYHGFLKYNQVTLNEIVWVAAVAILFTVHRYIFTKLFLNPIIKHVGFLSKDAIKFTESSCKELYYLILCGYAHYLINFKYPEYRYNISSHWIGVTPSMEVPFDVLLLYLVEAGFYFHSIYATIFMDEWKKDSVAMLIHHVLANSLIIFSLSFRYHRIGLVVFYLHDIADIVLEGSKLVICFKNRFPSTVLESLSTVGFLTFTFSWFWCRLWLYPQIVLFSASYFMCAVLPRANFYFFFNVMLWALLCLNVYWFHFIIRLIVRVATGDARTIEDTRSYDTKKELANGSVVGSNGIHSNNVKRRQVNGKQT